MYVVIFAINICTLISTLHPKIDTTENPTGQPLSLPREIPSRKDWDTFSASQKNAKFHAVSTASRKFSSSTPHHSVLGKVP